MGAWTIRVEPVNDEIPAVVRVRRALKYLGRACGLRCERVSEGEMESSAMLVRLVDVGDSEIVPAQEYGCLPPASSRIAWAGKLYEILDHPPEFRRRDVGNGVRWVATLRAAEVSGDDGYGAGRVQTPPPSFVATARERRAEVAATAPIAEPEAARRGCGRAKVMETASV